MADTHCFIGTREVGKTKLRTTSSGASNGSSGSKSGSRISDILRMRRLRLNRAKTTTASSLSDSLSESAANNIMRGHANRTNSNSLMSTSSDLYRNNSTHSYQSAKSTRSNMTAMTTLSSASSTSKRSGKVQISLSRIFDYCKILEIE